MSAEDSVMGPDASLEVPEYRLLSLRAVACVVLGALSVVALLHPLLWFVPAATVVLGWLTVRTLHRERDRLSGYRLAVVGTCLAALFLAWGPTQFAVSRWFVYRQARQFSDEWMKLVLAGEKKRAHYWTSPVSSRPRSEASYLRYYREEVYQQQMNEYFLRDPLKRLLGNSQARVAWRRTAGLTGTATKAYVSQEYEVDYPDGSHDLVLLVVLRQIDEYDDRVHWELANISVLDEHDH